MGLTMTGLSKIHVFLSLAIIANVIGEKTEDKGNIKKNILFNPISVFALK